MAFTSDEPDNAALRLPKFRCRLEITRLDPASGESLWEVHHEDVHVGLLEREAFDGLFSAPRRFGVISWHDGAVRELLQTPQAKLAWPRQRGGDAVLAYHCRGHLHITAVDLETGRQRVDRSIPVRASRSVDLYLTGALGIVNIDAHTYVPLDSDLRPTAVVKAGGWFRGLNIHEDGALQLWTTLGTTLIHPESGAVLGSTRF